MTELKSFLVMSIALIISLAFAKFDFSQMPFGYIINIAGTVSTLAIPIGYSLSILKRNDLL